MLAIRMQRTGRKGHAMFRVVVQDARRTPTSGKIVAQLGSYDPHAKTVRLDKEKAGFYLEHGAQPSERAAALLKKEGVKLPAWVQEPPKREGGVRNPEKRRSTRPDEPEAAEEAPTETTAETPVEETSDTSATEQPAEETATAKSEETEEKPAEADQEPAEEQPAETSEAETPADEADKPEDSKKDK